MSTRILLVTILCLGLAGTALGQTLHFDPATGSAYVLTPAANIFAARQAAVDLGGELVRIDDAAEQAFLEESFGTFERLWIGLSDEFAEGTYFWDQGTTPLGYSNWAAGQPDDSSSSENWVVFSADGAGGWGDEAFSSVHRAIVEIPAVKSPANGHIYLATGPVPDVFAARERARKMGGRLVTIDDAAEQAFLNASFPTNQRYWIGLSDEVTEGTFLWDSGSTSTYSNWFVGQPNNSAGIEDWTYMNHLPTGEWNDGPSTGSAFGVDRGLIEVPVRTTENFAVEVVTHIPGNCPASVLIDPESILDLTATGSSYSLCGTAQVVVRLGVTAFNGPGADLVISERNSSVTERYRVDLSIDGVTWFNVPGGLSGGTFSAASGIEMTNAGINHANFVRLRGASGQTGGGSPGPDLDGIEVVNYRAPRFEGVVRSYADVIVEENAAEPADAILGAPNAADFTLYTSSGVAGQSDSGFVSFVQGDEVTLAFRDAVVTDGPGADLILREWAGPEGDGVTVEVSADGLQWFALTGSLEAAPRYAEASLPNANVVAYDLAEVGLATAEFVRLTAATTAPELDSLEAVHSLTRRRTGSAEDFTLSTTLSGQGRPASVVKFATAGDRYEIDLRSPAGAFVGSTPVILGQLVGVGDVFTPVFGLPEVHIDPFLPGLVVVFDGNQAPFPLGRFVLPSQGLFLAFDVPTGLPGLRLRLQALAFDGPAANGIFAATDAFDVIFR